MHNSTELSTETNLALVKAPQITPLLDPYISLILRYGVSLVLIPTGLLGILSNLANMCVFLTMGIQETTNMKFFALSVVDLLVCISSLVAHIFVNQLVAYQRMPSGALYMGVGVAATYVAYPCLGCSAWVTAVLSVERYLCIATPLKVKDILTPQRTRILILIMAVYQSVFMVLFFINPGPPYYTRSAKRTLYFNCSFSAPTFICFFIVSISTVLLIIALRRSLEWRNKSSTQSSKESGDTKEKKATKAVLAICIIFIACFSLNIGGFVFTAFNPNFTISDPYLGSLSLTFYAFRNLLQMACSAVNMFVYYNMSTKYREIFNSLFCRRQANKEQ